MQPVHALVGHKEGVVAHLKIVDLRYIRLQLAQEAQRQTHLSIGQWRGKARFLQRPVPLVEVLLAAVDNARLPD